MRLKPIKQELTGFSVVKGKVHSNGEAPTPINQQKKAKSEMQQIFYLRSHMDRVSFNGLEVPNSILV